MSIRVTHRVQGMRQARRVFRRLAKLGEDPSELLDAFGQTLVESAVRRLSQTNVGPDGEKWEPSERATRTGGKIQFDTGMAGLAGSIVHRTLPDAVEVGSPLIYAAQRQFGGTIRAKPGSVLAFPGTATTGNAGPTTIFATEVTQPARPYLGISDDDADELASLALDFIEDILRPAEGGSP
ncbi:MAG: phage virion morphogenesis protein [Pseudomonadota bacterium]